MPVINATVALVCVGAWYRLLTLLLHYIVLLLGAGYYCYGNVSLCFCLVPVINFAVTLVCVVAWCRLLLLW